MEITKIKGLIISLHGIHGNNWAFIARGVQEKGFYTELDIRSLADKIRKSVSRGALSHLNLGSKSPAVLHYRLYRFSNVIRDSFLQFELTL